MDLIITKKYNLFFIMPNKFVEYFINVNYFNYFEFLKHKIIYFLNYLNIKKNNTINNLSFKNLNLILLKNNFFYLKKSVFSPIYSNASLTKKYLKLNTKSIKNKRKLFENKKRTTFYIFLNFLLVSNSFFDFFSNDSINFLTSSQSKVIYQNKIKNICKFSFFKIIKSFYNSYYFFKNYLIESKKKLKKIIIAKSLYLFFKKISILMQKFFKSPIINYNILSLMLIESNNLKFSKIKTNLLVNLISIDSIRDNIFKNDSTHERQINSKIKKNQYYFFFLLKKLISENSFKNFIRSNNIIKIIPIFRFLIIKKFLKLKFKKIIFQKMISEIIIFNYNRI